VAHDSYSHLLLIILGAQTHISISGDDNPNWRLKMFYRSLSASALALGVVLPLAFISPSQAEPGGDNCKMNEIEDAGTASCIPKPGFEDTQTQGFVVKQQPGVVEEPADLVGSSGESNSSGRGFSSEN
jgi:hypothetical protein